jgi:hypothetical protein
MAKMSYSAAVRVPAQLRALMSAVPLEGDQDQGEGGCADVLLRCYICHASPRQMLYRLYRCAPHAPHA